MIHGHRWCRSRANCAHTYL